MTEKEVLRRKKNALDTVSRALDIVDDLYSGTNPAYEGEEAAIVLRVAVPDSGIEVSGARMKEFIAGLPEGATVDVNKHQNHLICDIKLL